MRIQHLLIYFVSTRHAVNENAGTSANAATKGDETEMTFSESREVEVFYDQTQRTTAESVSAARLADHEQCPPTIRDTSHAAESE